MADPALYLPPALTEDSIRELLKDIHLPNPCAIVPLRTIAAYHTIYLIKFSSDVAAELKPAEPNEPDGSVSLILRVAGKHLPRIKTLNELAAMIWVKENTKIPIPAVVRFDASEDNALGYEFTILEKVQGVSVDTIYDTLSDAQKASLVSELMGFLLELHRQEWHHAGGLSLDENGKVIPGRFLTERFWQGPEIAQYWGPDETIDTLNIKGPFDSYTTYVQGEIEQYVRNIRKHPSLEWMRAFLPRLESFNAMLDSRAAELNKETRFILTQKDMHFGNIMCDPATFRITAVLDWEFSAVLPPPFWSPGGGFLWSGQNKPEAVVEQKKLFDVFAKICREREPALLADFEAKTLEPHKSIVTVVERIRAIVEQGPRGHRLEDARIWWETAEEALGRLGV